MGLRDYPGLPEHPRLAPGVTLVTSEDGPFLEDRTLGLSRTGLGAGGADFAKHVAPLLDGHHSIEEIASALDDTFEGASLLAALDALADKCLVTEGDLPDEPIHGLRAYRLLRVHERRCQAAVLGDARLERGLMGPAELELTAWRRWYRGWWAENLHFAASAAKKFALTAGLSERYRHDLGEFFLEEYDHVLIFRNGARALGIDPDAVMAAAPLPEMAALSSFILEGCRLHPLYLGWVADQVERAARFYMREPDGRPRGLRKILEERFADVPAFLHEVFHHADLEEGAEHSSYGCKMFEETVAVTAPEMNLLLDLAATTERLFAWKELAVLQRFGLDPHADPALPAAGSIQVGEGQTLFLDEPVSAFAARSAAALSVERLDVRALAGAWAEAHRGWALGTLATPALTSSFELRFTLTTLAVGVTHRDRALEPLRRDGPAILPARGLAAVLREGAETDSELALAQTVWLEVMRERLAPLLGDAAPAQGLVPVPLRGPNGATDAARALRALGPAGRPRVQAVDAHLTVLHGLFEAVLEWIRVA